MRTSVKYVLLFFALVAMIGIGLTLFSGDSEARLCVWDGGSADALASTAANWDTDTAPVAGDNILFDGLNATGDDACTWDLAIDSFGTFTIGAGYSGTITQASDMHITGFSMASGTFTGLATKWVYCTGDFIQSAGTLSSNTINLESSSNINIKITTIRQLRVLEGTICNVTTSVPATGFAIGGVLNYGHINANCSLKCNVGNIALSNTSGTWNINSPYYLIFSIGLVNVYNKPIGDITGNFKVFNEGSAYDSSIVLKDSLFNINSLLIEGSSTKNSILDLNGHSLTATTITVGTRGILDCGNGTIICSALTSTSGTITEDTATWIFNDGAVVTATSGEKFYNVQMKGDCDFVNAINVTNELRWIDVPTEYGALDVYLDSIYSQTIPTYTFGPEQTAAAEYSYLPDVQISMSQFYEDIDFSIYAYISTNLPVTYNITGTSSSWLSYHEGRIVGMPPDIGNYTYTITATHASGSVDVVNGYILVGSLSTAEYSYDQIWGLILWIVITAFMLIGLLLNIPLIQIVAFMGTIGSIVASLRIPEFEVFLMMFALGNSALFFIGMVRYRR